MELALLAIAAIGVMISVYGKYSYERARRRSHHVPTDIRAR